MRLRQARWLRGQGKVENGERCEPIRLERRRSRFGLRQHAGRATFAHAGRAPCKLWDLVRFAELAGPVEASASARLRSLDGPTGARVARRARELREQLYAILAAAHSEKAVPKASLARCGRSPSHPKCGASDCEVYFIDTSKAHRRQWCSMQNCGNREKQRRWRGAS